MLLAVFNLLPVPPLDGFKVFGVVLPDKWYSTLLQYERFIGIAFLFVVIVFRGVLPTVLGWILVPLITRSNTRLHGSFSSFKGSWAACDAHVFRVTV